jgi:hypothetical protein
MTASRRVALTLLLTACAVPACNRAGSNSTAGSAKPAASSPVSAGTIFTIKVPAKGSTQTEQEKSSMQLTVAVTFAGKTTKSTTQQHEEHDTTERVLGANAEAPTKVQVTFDKRVETDTDAKGKTKTKRSPVDGKSYIAEVKGADISVTGPTGKKVTTAETKVVEQDEDDLGKPDPFTKILRGRSLKKGDQLQLPKNVVAELLGDTNKDMKMQIDKVSLTFQGTRRDGSRTDGLFDLALDVTGHPDPAVGMQMKINGIVVIDTATAWPVSMELRGPIHFSGGTGHGAKMAGQGNMDMTVSYTYK